MERKIPVTLKCPTGSPLLSLHCMSVQLRTGVASTVAGRGPPTGTGAVAADVMTGTAAEITAGAAAVTAGAAARVGSKPRLFTR